MNRSQDINTEIEVELPYSHGYECASVTVTGVVVASGWDDLPDDCWTEDLRVMFDDGSEVPQDMVDSRGRKVWDVAEDHALHW